MTSMVVLAQADSVANWVAAIGQVLGAIGTFAAVVVALRLARWERRRDMAERRDREAAQARLVTIAMHGDCVEITNHSEQPVHQPRTESMGDPRPPVRWNPDRTVEVLAPHAMFTVRFDYIDADGNRIEAKFDADGIATAASSNTVEKRVTANDVTITSTDMSGLRWRRTGNGEPVRIVQPALQRSRPSHNRLDLTTR